MKLIVAIVHDDDTRDITDKLSKAGFSVTKLSSSGGFLKLGNTTLICGVDDDKVQEVVKIIEEEGKSRTQLMPVSSGLFKAIQPLSEITVGGATIFVLNVEDFIKL